MEDNFEKRNALIMIRCSDTEKNRWRAVLGVRKTSKTIRKILNQEVDRIERRNNKKNNQQIT